MLIQCLERTQICCKSKVADILKESKCFSLIHNHQSLILKIG